MSDELKDYIIGKGKPPKHTQFKKGKSGNPGGRPKGTKRIFMSVYELINKEISIIENGEEQKILCSDAIAKKLMKEALMKGNMKSMQMILQLEERAEAHLDSIRREHNPSWILGDMLPHREFDSFFERVAVEEGKRLRAEALRALDTLKDPPL